MPSQVPAHQMQTQEREREGERERQRQRERALEREREREGRRTKREKSMELQGALHIQGVYNWSWKKRYFKIFHADDGRSYLVYFLDDDVGSMAVEKGRIALSNATLTFTPAKPTHFEVHENRVVHEPSRVYKLRADTEALCEAWVFGLGILGVEEEN